MKVKGAPAFEDLPSSSFKNEEMMGIVRDQKRMETAYKNVKKSSFEELFENRNTNIGKDEMS